MVSLIIVRARFMLFGGSLHRVNTHRSQNLTRPSLLYTNIPIGKFLLISESRFFRKRELSVDGAIIPSPIHLVPFYMQSNNIQIGTFRFRQK